ncbi:MAG: aminotransferase class V-fold PLP-dependent enzyme [Bdellovibrionales bacterium]|nr:aminotransferase class V-fold PLP-dependent enzyme [Bdellovibrionales bacterium]
MADSQTDSISERKQSPQKTSARWTTRAHGNGLSRGQQDFVEHIKREFPIFSRYPNLAYLDTAASAQKTSSSIKTMTSFLKNEYANVHRGAYALSAQASEKFWSAREAVARFLGGVDPSEVIFTRGATEAINLVAYSFGQILDSNASILLTELEHHSNIVPWQLLAGRTGIQLHFAPIREDATLDEQRFEELVVQTKPAIVSFTGLSNAFGSVTDIRKLTRMAHSEGAKVLVDGAQLLAHGPVNVAHLEIDFLAFSSHKIYGPTGLGVLYGKRELLERMPPFLGGGDMIERVSTTGSTFAEIPKRFEAGTPAIAEVLGFAASLDQLERFGWESIRSQEENVFRFGRKLLLQTPGVKIIGPSNGERDHRSILAFTVEGVHPHDLATVADAEGVQIRAGHHCAMPALRALGLQSTCRASVGCYTSERDFEKLALAIHKAQSIFR